MPVSDASAQAREAEELAGIEEYDELLDRLDELLEEALAKVDSGRVYDAENERVRIQWLRIAKELLAEKRKVTNDRKRGEIEERLERLEALEEEL